MSSEVASLKLLLLHAIVARWSGLGKNLFRIRPLEVIATSGDCLYTPTLQYASFKVCSGGVRCYKSDAESHRLPQASYYDKNNRPTAALYRARQPYLVKNAITGVCIVGFVGLVCKSRMSMRRRLRTVKSEGPDTSPDSFTIRAIGQDDFSDVPIPDAPVQTGATVGSTPNAAVPKK